MFTYTSPCRAPGFANCKFVCTNKFGTKSEITVFPAVATLNDAGHPAEPNCATVHHTVDPPGRFDGAGGWLLPDPGGVDVYNNVPVGIGGGRGDARNGTAVEPFVNANDP